MREQSQGQPSSAELRYIRTMAYQRWGVAGVEITNRAQFFVVAASERGAGVDATGGVDDRAVKLETELGQRVGLINLFWRQELAADLAEYPLGGGEQVLILLPTARYVEQAEENARAADPNGVVEVPRVALPGKHGCNFGVPQNGESGGHGLDGWSQLAFPTLEQRLHNPI